MLSQCSVGKSRAHAIPRVPPPRIPPQTDQNQAKPYTDSEDPPLIRRLYLARVARGARTRGKGKKTNAPAIAIPPRIPKPNTTKTQFRPLPAGPTPYVVRVTRGFCLFVFKWGEYKTRLNYLSERAMALGWLGFGLTAVVLARSEYLWGFPRAQCPHSGSGVGFSAHVVQRS